MRIFSIVIKMITKEKFIECVGREPELDDLERVNCEQAGEVGHWSCGWCPEHNLPRFEPDCVLFHLAKEEEDAGGFPGITGALLGRVKLLKRMKDG